MDFSVTPEFLAMVAATVLSLFFSYIPGLNTWYASLATEVKQAIMAGLLLVVSAAVFAGGCYGVFGTDLTCDKAGVIKLVSIFIAAIIANQAVYKLSPQTSAVKQAKA